MQMSVMTLSNKLEELYRWKIVMQEGLSLKFVIQNKILFQVIWL